MRRWSMPRNPRRCTRASSRPFLEGSRDWLDDYAAFEVLSGLHHGTPWWTWAPEYRDGSRSRDGARASRAGPGLARASRNSSSPLPGSGAGCTTTRRARGVYLFGDVPFYVAPDSAEAWANRGQFQLDATGRPTAVAGVPPDYFSALGQLWGESAVCLGRDAPRTASGSGAHAFRHQLERVDLLRIDHFRALAAHWAVPAGAPDARSGSWQPSYGREMLQAPAGPVGAPAGGGRGSGRDHPGRGGVTPRFRTRRHARAAVRLRRQGAITCICRTCTNG